MKNSDSEITEEKIAEGIRFTIRGRVNSDNADELQEILEKALNEGHKKIVLHMFWVDFLSSAGIRVLLKAYQDANTAGGKFGIEMPSQKVKNVLGMTALEELLI